MDRAQGVAKNFLCAIEVTEKLFLKGSLRTSDETVILQRSATGAMRMQLYKEGLREIL